MDGLKNQMDNLVKASSLMFGGDGATTDESSIGSQEVQDNMIESSKEIDKAEDIDEIEHSSGDNDNNESEASTDEEENVAHVQRNIMNEARFALRAQDDFDVQDYEEGKRATKRRRRAAPINSDYGDEDEANADDLDRAARTLASTVNTISQRNKKSSNFVSAEVEDEHNEERFLRGLEMMENELGDKFEDEDEDIDINDDDDDIDLDDDDDFYSQMTKKSKEKKEYKKSLYAVAPKYPGMDEEIEGERAVGTMIMKNRGLVAHKAKINRNPRVKKREQYRKALIRRKGAVREVRTDEGHKYGGEQTGIKSGLSRSRKL